MTPGFSLRRIFNRRRYFYARVALNPQQALDLCIGYWVSTGASGETPGMREQLAQQGWVGTEITTGSDARHIAVSSVFDEITPFGVFPSTAPRTVKQTRQENTPILIAARSCSVAGRPASEVWCFDTRVSQRNTPTTKEDVGHYLQDLAVTLQLDELLLAQPELLFEGDLPTDHIFAGRNVIAMRQAARKESRRGR
ncbi:hypothetical protein [Xylanimonas cellulosilytica]|uniref:hypothetical protein n=1 Tax=Xylanimonas cellulosilytica TaxID=186189 RepID=UPI000660B168|nr:hypothetical protein [Xylanimonas cellulosilytica]